MVFPGIKPLRLENLSVTVSKASNFWGVSGIATMKSIVKGSNGTAGVNIGFSLLYDWCLLV